MTPKNMELLNRIEAFSFDEPGTSFTFAQRLARENGWPAPYTRRVLREYRRFAFLAMTAGHPVCPSEAVDQAWHQHLTFTQNYWEDFCGKVLGSPLHHGPTRGGSKEAVKHHDMYERTLASYREAFGEEPPADIWEPSEIRFGDGGKYVRVNRKQVWIIPKPRWLRQAALFALVATLPAFMGFQPAVAEVPLFDSPGPEFILGYIVMIIVALIVCGIIKAMGKSVPGKAADPDSLQDPYLVATLTGGPHLAVYAAVAELSRRNLISVAGPESISVTAGEERPQGLRPFERVVLEAMPEGVTGTAELRALVAGETKAMEEILQKRDLLLRPLQQSLITAKIRFIIGALLAIGLVKLALGFSRGKPVGFLVTLVMVTALLFFMFRGKSYRTSLGDAALRDLRKKHTPTELKSRIFDNPQPVGGLTPLAVGLYGLPFLMSTPLGGLEQSLVPPGERKDGNNGCSSGCGSGCSSSGDSGGGSSGCSSGCGGCGGGD